MRDIVGVLKVSGDQIDMAYIEHWALKMGLGQIWADVQARMT
jgi:hypothetical protein